MAEKHRELKSVRNMVTQKTKQDRFSSCEHLRVHVGFLAVDGEAAAGYWQDRSSSITKKCECESDPCQYFSLEALVPGSFRPLTSVSSHSETSLWLGTASIGRFPPALAEIIAM